MTFVPVGATPANAKLTALTGTDLLVSASGGLLYEPPGPDLLLGPHER